MDTRVANVQDLIKDDGRIPAGWRANAIINDDNMTYLAWNEKSREAIVVDPMKDDWDTLLSQCGDLRGYRFIAVIDTHTHADHISCAADLAEELGAPLVQHQLSPSRRVHLRVSRDMDLSTAAGPLKFLVTPGHTQECITPVWGPFLFGGDTLMYGDTGRDDLPGGDPGMHYDSLVKIKANVQPETLMLPGHDGEGGRVSSWKTQLKVSPGLSQDREAFINDAGAYVGPSPKLLKESLYWNFK